MSKILFSIIFIFTFCFGDFKVVSWNLKNVSLNSLMFKKSIASINEYIKSNNDADVIALQELRDRQIIYFLSGGLKDILFSDFARYASNYKGKGTHQEVYGFLVNKKYKDIKQVELGSYKDFKRPPSGVILDKKYAVVNIHIVYGKSKINRIREVKKLKNIYKELEDKYNIDPKNIIIAGDFNIQAKELKEIFKDKQVLIEEKTTVGKNKLSQSYDHFIVDKSLKTDAKVNTKILKDYQFFTKNISDHLPVELVIKQ